jgi:hypothetical protein
LGPADPSADHLPALQAQPAPALTDSRSESRWAKACHVFFFLRVHPESMIWLLLLARCCHSRPHFHGYHRYHCYHCRCCSYPARHTLRIIRLVYLYFMHVVMCHSEICRSQRVAALLGRWITDLPCWFVASPGCWVALRPLARTEASSTSCDVRCTMYDVRCTVIYDHETRGCAQSYLL